MTLSGCTGSGIRPYHYSAIINCTLEDIGGSAIPYSLAKYNTYAFNTVRCVGGYGMYGNQSTHFLNNYVEVSGTGGWGIYQSGGNCCAMYNTVVMTHASPNAGISVVPLGGVAICNSIYHSGSPSGSGLLTAYFSQSIVAGNLIEGFATGVEKGSADTYTMVRNNAASGDFRPTAQSMSLGGWPTQHPNVGTLTRYYKGAIQPGGAPIIGGARLGGRAA